MTSPHTPRVFAGCLLGLVILAWFAIQAPSDRDQPLTGSEVASMGVAEEAEVLTRLDAEDVKTLDDGGIALPMQPAHTIVRVLLEGKNELPEGLRGFALVGGEAVALAPPSGSGIEVPADAEQLFLVSDSGRPTLVPVGPGWAEVIIPRAHDFEVRIRERDTGEAIADACVTLAPSLELLPRLRWVSEPLARVLEQVSDTEGRARLFEPYLHVPAYAADIPMTIHVQAGSRRQSFESRLQLPASPRRAVRELHVAPLRVFELELRDERGSSAGAAAEIWLAEGAGILSATVRADSVLEMSIPISEDWPLVDGIVVHTAAGKHLFIERESLGSSASAIRFDSGVLPVSGMVTGSEVPRDRILVGSYPLSEDVEERDIARGRVEHALPYSAIVWTPIDEHGEFEISEGWHGRTTAVLAMDRMTGVCLGGTRVGSGMCELMLPAWAAVLIQQSASDEKRPRRLWLDPEGGVDEGRLAIELDTAEPVRVEVPAGSYLLTLEDDGVEFRLQNLVASAGRETTVLLPALRVVQFRSQVRGSIQGPLARATVYADGGQRFTTNSEGWFGGSLAMPPGGIRLVYKWPNPYGIEFGAIATKIGGGSDVPTVEFKEGLVEFRLPPSVRNAGDASDVVVRVIQGVGPSGEIPVDSSSGSRVLLPEGTYLVTMAWRTSAGQHLSSTMELPVVPDGTTLLEFTELE